MRILDWFRDRESLIQRITGLERERDDLYHLYVASQVDNDGLRAKCIALRRIAKELEFRMQAMTFKIPGYDVPKKTPAINKKLEMQLQQQATPPWNKKEKL